MTGSQEVAQLTSTLTRATGAAADAILAKLAESQERVRTLERRQREVTERLEAVASEEIEPEAVSRALAQFTELWSVPLTPERERVTRLFFDRVELGGGNEEMKIAVSATGARLLAADFASAESPS